MFNFLNQQIYMVDAMALDRLAQAAARPGMQVVELGTFTGRSSLAMLPYIKQHGGRMTCVDWFKGNEGLGDEVGLTVGYAQSNVLEVFRKNLKEGGFEDCVNVIVGKTEDVAPTIAEGFADLVFVDADHRYTGVRRDILEWYPKVREGGIICGHDFERPMRECDEAEVLKHCETDYVNGHHYGVIRAVSELFGEVQHQGVVWWAIKQAGAFPALEAAIEAHEAAKAQAAKAIQVGPAPEQRPVVDQFLETYPPEALYQEAQMAWGAGDYVNAMRGAKALNRRFPSFAMGWKLAYHILEELEQDDEAERHLGLGLHAAGMHPELLNLLGVRNHRKGEAEKAVKAFQGVLIPQVQAILNLGHGHLAAQAFEEAKVCFQLLAQLAPDEGDAYLGLAECALRTHDGPAFARHLARAEAMQADPEVVAGLQAAGAALLSGASHA